MNGADGLARCLMVLGTGSHTGKSVMVAALCRILAREGRRVAPFKAQNMSLNSYVTAEGGEMGRAQVLQAQAARIEPHTDMNPILLKPSSDEKAQVILAGRPVGDMDAIEYHSRKQEFLPEALASLERLRRRFEVVVLEGAGSPAEINLRDGDIVNMRMAEAADAPVLLVGDIDRGGVFASLVGTVELLEAGERALVAGYVINKFRGSRALLDGGLDFLEERTGIPVVGVVPYIRDIGLDEEDTVNLEAPSAEAAGGTVDIAVVHLPHISNATDFEPLAAEPCVRLRYVTRPENAGEPDAIVIPGSKSTVGDLTYLRESGMNRLIARLAGAGVPVLGICGGYQMLGMEILDPQGCESPTAGVRGLGLLPVTTTMMPEKETHRVHVRASKPVPLLGIDASTPPLEGYEIHMGESSIEGKGLLLVTREGDEESPVSDGAVGEGGNVFGCYIHGLFDDIYAREGFVNFLRARKGLPPVAPRGEWAAFREGRLDRLADIVGEALDMAFVESLLDPKMEDGVKP